MENLLSTVRSKQKYMKVLATKFLKLPFLKQSSTKKLRIPPEKIQIFNRNDSPFPLHITLLRFDNNVICNSNTRMMLDYLRSQDYNVDLFFKHYTTHSMAFLDDYYKWISYDDYIEFVEALLEFTGQKNPRILRNYGKIAFEKDQTFANFLQIMLRFVGVPTIYELIPVVNRNYDNNLSFQYIKKNWKEFKCINIVFQS